MVVECVLEKVNVCLNGGVNACVKFPLEFLNRILNVNLLGNQSLAF